MPGPMGGSMGPRGFLTDEEKQNAPKVSWKLVKRILSYLKPYWLQFLLVFLAILVSAGVGLLPSIITSQIVDKALGGRDMALLIRLLIAAFGTLTASEVIGVLESYINAWIGSKIIYDMRNQMYGHLQTMPHAFFTTEKQGDIITRMNSDISGVSSVISGTLSSIVRNVTVVITTLVALILLSPPLALIGVVVIPFLIIPTRSAGKTRWKLASESQAKHDEMNQLVNETLSVSGSLLVKLFTREKREMERFEAVNNDVTKLSMKEQRSGKWFIVLMGMFTQIGPLLIYLGGGFFMIHQKVDSVTIGTITASVALINRLYRPVQSLLNIHVDFTRSLALFTRIFHYFDMVPAIRQPKHPRCPIMEGAGIRYDHVAFSYSPDKPLLTDIDFSVPAGKMYAIVGPSGSGKSTIVNLLPRLYDVDAGSVRIGYTDVRAIDLGYLRKNIGVVTQDSYLFNGTIRENLLYAKEDATDAEIMAALETASLTEFIKNQPDGLDTVVGNRGLKLSGGEKQRLSIARIILKNPSILILDEATSALDSISENAIQDALETLMRGRTSIVIAHRLSTILKADRILVVANGTITEQGTHDELLQKNGIYRELYETQFRKILEHDTEKAE